MADIARLVRRICVLREKGEAAAAARLEENEFSTAIRDIRLADGPEALPESEILAIFLNEERRVADAAVLAELLIPKLAGSIPSASGPVLRQSPTSEREVTVPVSRVAETVAGSPAIPDLLDAMFAADDAARRQSGSQRVTR